MAAPDTVIVSAGLVTPVGLSLKETAASARARVARLREIAWHDRRLQPFVVGRVPDAGLPPLSEALAAQPLQAREARMLRLAQVALEEALAVVAPTAAVPLLLGLPEHHTTQPLDGPRFLARLAQQCPGRLQLEASVAAPRGRAAGLMALRQARRWLEEGRFPFVLVGGVDSLVDLYVLGTLDAQQRVRGETVSDGFTPSEGAAFVLLGTAAHAAAQGLPVLAPLQATASGQESGHLYADEPYRGEGLAATFAQLFERPPPTPVATVYASFNGERYWAREFGVARTRHAAAFSPEAQMEHPAEVFGDLGAAHGPALLALAAHALHGGYRPAPCLVYASSDHADRAAALLTRAAASA